MLLPLAESVAGGCVLASLAQRCLCFSSCAAWSAGNCVCGDVLRTLLQFSSIWGMMATGYVSFW